MRKYIYGLLCLLLLTLTGCTVEADRIYTLCRIKDGVNYYYNASGEFFQEASDGSLTPSLDLTLINKPALQCNPSEGDYVFIEVLPNSYKATKESLEHYLYRLTDGDSSKITTAYTDVNNLELFVELDDCTYRVLFNIRGEVRIYSSDFSLPIYLIEES